MALLVAKDSGYGDYKGFIVDPKAPGGGQGYSFSAVISSPANIPETAEIGDTAILEDLHVEYRGHHYWLGNKAFANRNRTMNFDPNKLTNELELVKLLGSLGYVNHLTGIDRFKVITGIPVEQYNHYKDVVSNSWKGTFHINFRGNPIDLQVVAVKPIAQGAGVYYDLGLGVGHVLDNGIFEKRVLVFDMGTKTTNVVPMQAGKYLNDMAMTIWSGVSNLHLNLKEILVEKGLNYDMAEVSQVVRQGYYIHKGERYPIGQQLEAAAKPVIEKIIAESQSKIDLARDIEIVVFASGGACIDPAASLFERSMRKYVSDVRKVPDPLSNVRGYGKLGAFLENMGKL